MSQVSIAIRPATADDAAAISMFAAAAFADAFGAQNEPENLALHLEQTYSPQRQSAEMTAPGACYLLAMDGDRLAGFGYIEQGLSLPAVTGPAPCEVRRFYVGREWHGRGVAQSLMAALVAAARRGGARTLWLSTWELAAQARAFYAKTGFTDVGSTVFVVGNDRQTDRILVLDLDRG